MSTEHDGQVQGLFRDVFERLEQAEVELDRELAEDESALEEARELRAVRARKGELGVEWQRVQQRIDLNETTLEAVFSGADESPAARTLRERSQKNLRSLAEEWHESDALGDEEPSPAAQMSGAAAESLAYLAEATQRIEDTLRAMGRTTFDREM